MISVNDVYKSREDLLKTFSEFIANEKHRFVLKEGRKTISLVCKARKDCYCDAQITAHFKKRENVFQIKKVKTAHKCPLGYHFNTNFLLDEIKRRSGEFLGDVVKQLNDDGIRVGYLTAWKVVNRDFVAKHAKAGCIEYEVNVDAAEDKTSVHTRDSDENRSNVEHPKGKYGGDSKNSVENSEDNNNPYSVHENSDMADERNGRGDGVRKAMIGSGCAFYLDEESGYSEENEDVVNEALAGFRDEFLHFNEHSRCVVGDRMIYTSFPYLQHLRNVLETKIYVRKNGCVVYGVGYDPVDKPLIVSFVVSDNSVESTLRFFFANEPRVYSEDDKDRDARSPSKSRVKRRRTDDENAGAASEAAIPITYLTDYDERVIRILEDLGVNYFVKTRSICKRFDLSEVERVFKIINCGQAGSIDIDLKPERYIVREHLFGINNFSEVDLDFVFYAVYNFDLFDCLTSILKLSADNLRERTYKSFGSNVLLKIERNKRMASGFDPNFQVDLDGLCCTCGKYQTFLIPCQHACSVIVSQGKDPLEFVSRLYSPEIMRLLGRIHPVVDIPVKCQLDRFLLRRGPGRPKKQNPVVERR